DGTNVLAVFDAVRTACARARAGEGPRFIEAPVYRFRAHGGNGDDSHTGYRAEAERDAWAAYDPITMFGEFLTARGLLNASAIRNMESMIEREINVAFEVALASPDPGEHELYQHVYAD